MAPGEDLAGLATRLRPVSPLHSWPSLLLCPRGWGPERREWCAAASWGGGLGAQRGAVAGLPGFQTGPRELRVSAPDRPSLCSPLCSCDTLRLRLQMSSVPNYSRITWAGRRGRVLIKNANYAPSL